MNNISVKIVKYLDKLDNSIRYLFKILGIMIGGLLVLLLMVLIFALPALACFCCMKINGWMDKKWQKKIKDKK